MLQGGLDNLQHGLSIPRSYLHLTHVVEYPILTPTIATNMAPV